MSFRRPVRRGSRTEALRGGGGSSRALSSRHASFNTAHTEELAGLSKSLEGNRVLLEARLLESFFTLGSAAFLVALLAYSALEPTLGLLDALYFTMATFTTASLLSDPCHPHHRKANTECQDLHVRLRNLP